MKTINVRFNAFLKDDNRFVNNSYEVVDIESCKSEKEINEKLIELSEKWKIETIGVSFKIL